MKTDDLRIARTRPLIAPAILAEEIPETAEAAQLVHQSRRAIADIVHQRDSRWLIIVGPCSIHDPAAALDYAERLCALAERVRERALLVMRVYFEKPRTTVGWKGYISDPFLDETFQVNQGLRRARTLLADITAMGLPTATEFLDTTLGQYYTDFICWGAIGARTVESQVHRQLASGLSMPVGIKNRTDGNVAVAVDAMEAAARPHLFPSLTKEGAPALLETTGNDDCHLVLRGGAQPNYDPGSVADALAELDRRGRGAGIVVDCSHGNSSKDPSRQVDVAQSVAAQRAAGSARLVGLMLESHLVGGRQNIARSMTYGQSITDACLAFDATRALVESLVGT
jgi:3-deoxy-7-phosphoheptulonate synthase